MNTVLVVSCGHHLLAVLVEQLGSWWVAALCVGHIQACAGCVKLAPEEHSWAVVFAHNRSVFVKRGRPASCLADNLCQVGSDAHVQHKLEPIDGPCFGTRHCSSTDARFAAIRIIW